MSLEAIVYWIAQVVEQRNKEAAEHWKLVRECRLLYSQLHHQQHAGRYGGDHEVREIRVRSAVLSNSIEQN